MIAGTPVAKLDRLTQYLTREFDGYPFSEVKDVKYFARLIVEFHDLDIEEELKSYHAWTLDQPDHKKIYYRSRFRSWLKTARSFLKSPPAPELPHWVRRRYAAARY